ncbi:SDR family NAD(P)-dependent oxidoreductase [Rhizobium leguminosarum]|uniref:Short-chain dehydrogenase n=1 Tax=Rhizobium leguminosarum TaxID=384 RepID=A0A1B1CK30_RHILE|nr:SDR family NAD(P)-dependent oxidoreductase [Rhizobium leguminosarum]ANP90076.1 short-chain dehydrogenase [Rhizobium leguminosarum]
MSPLVVITGVGPGTGSAMARRFHDGGYQVAMLARTAERLRVLENELPNAFAVPCDVADPAALATALDTIEQRAGVPRVVIHNAVGGAFGNFLDIEPEILQQNFQINVMALLHLARWVAPRMEAAGGGSLLVTGNTAAYRGKAGFAGFAPSKAAQRVLTESIAREMGPRGVHVSFMMIDAVIDVPSARARFADEPDDFFIQPSDIAEEVWHVTHQPRSAWSFLTELRPFREPW